MMKKKARELECMPLRVYLPILDQYSCALAQAKELNACWNIV